jgi:hypothetical protein
MRDRGAQARQQCDLRPIEVDGMNGDEARAQQTDLFQPGNRPHSELAFTVPDFVVGFVQMRVDGDLVAPKA